MRPVCPCLVALLVWALGACGLSGADTEPAQPSEEQLKAAQQAYAGFGAKYAAKTHPVTGQAVHQFLFPGASATAR
jgi:hypothetical protein